MTSSRYRWVIVTAGGLLGCVAIGGMFSLPVFLQPLVGASTAAIFAPMMATVTGWFDTPSQPCRLAGVGRDGNGTHDDVAARCLAGL